MKKYIDMGIDFVRKHSYFNFVEIGENWIAKLGVWALYFVFPAMLLFMVAGHYKSIDNYMGNPLLVFLAGTLLCVVFGYIADKTLEYVKSSIKSAPSKLVNGAILDILALIIALFSIFGFFAAFYGSIKMRDANTFLYGLAILVGGAYLVAVLLNPEKSLNVKVTESATPAQSFIAIFALLYKLLYRIVPVAFGVWLILSVFDGFEALFSKNYFIYRFEDLQSGVIWGSLLPLISYFVFLLLYFFLDIQEAILRILSSVQKIADSKESHKSK